MDPVRIKSIHSRYNPLGEAERYINSLCLNEEIRFFILIEPGLGYIIAPLKKKVPNARIIALHACPKAEINRDGLPAVAPDSEWYTDSGIPIQDFLENEISDTEAAGIRILEWRPALSVYGKAYLALVEEATAFIKRSDANARTTKGFGRRWFGNFFKNLEFIRKILCPAPLSVPFLVTGAGPSLEDSLPLIREASRRANLFILAASSSVAALEAGDLIPNLVISTDGGNWAAFHLHDCFREKSAGTAPRYPLAAALSAALPSQCESIPVLPISDGSLWQTLILKELRIPFIVLPQRGTVSASALDLAFALTEDEIFIAGMDLANRDIKSHARPYSFDSILESRAGRLDPVYSQALKRSSMLKAGGSFGIYASWFEKQIRRYPKRLHSLGNNNHVFSSLRTAELSDRSGVTPVTAKFNTITLDYKDNPSRKACAVLEKALNDPEHSMALREELNSLLFPGEKAAPLNELSRAVRSLAYRNRGSHQYE